ncbi:carboxypeptidase M32 [Wolbachia endosymbiont of Ctenocephalides felis wCfeJ]|uniref:carboxypeptidase M32 n=1 Tax=Wolbachia endosymbiont of Ctenocephalides felis wCfeJ TaxID=2732594 RepID=UPI0014485775|nr:carboxypeptidase M32 [Wolbachia endosymbiont of Ctenocephalides felis wCfeJ]WCR57759.1 MAG: Thermostable carboxypeptidase 1 [Wolbachia endosymbiont of Ctenocephalides felis wCfeJ]
MESCKFLEGVLYRVRNIENTLKVLSQSQLNVEDKVEQMGLLEEIRHEIISHDIVKESLAEAGVVGSKKSANNWQLKLIERMNKSSSAISFDLVRSLSKAKVECQNLWRLSQSETGNLKKLKERFADLVKLIREVASIKSQQLKCSKYDSLLADYDSDITEKDIREIFPKVGRFFSENVDKVIEKQKKDKAIHIQKVATHKQIELGSVCLQKMGVKLCHASYYGSIDYNESDFCWGLFLLLRHSGYEIYQKCLTQNSISSPTEQRVIYETQGLFMERMIGTSREFIEFIQPYIKEKFTIKGKTNAKASSVENLHLIFNKINLSSSLKNADEFSLLAHIMLRTKLEQDMIDGRLEVKDLHDAWLDGMKHYKIPVKAENELDTYFQDEYWASGIMGYFPIKIMALVAAVQVFSFIKRNHYEFLGSIIKGDFSLLIGWLSQNIYSTKCGSSDLLKKVTGRRLDVECCTSYLSEKYNLSQ